MEWKIVWWAVAGFLLIALGAFPMALTPVFGWIFGLPLWSVGSVLGIVGLVKASERDVPHKVRQVVWLLALLAACAAVGSIVVALSFFPG